MAGYTTVVNCLDYSAVAIPVLTADKNVDVVGTDFKPLSELDEKVMKSCELLLFSLLLSCLILI